MRTESSFDGSCPELPDSVVDALEDLASALRERLRDRSGRVAVDRILEDVAAVDPGPHSRVAVRRLTATCLAHAAWIEWMVHEPSNE